MGGPDEWTALDRAKAEAYAEWKLGNCPRCGTREETFDPRRGGHRHALVADFHHCQGCQLIDELDEQLRKDNDRPKGVTVQLVPNPKFLIPETASDVEEVSGHGR